MKFKNIPSDRIVHTESINESKALLKHLDKLGYEWLDGDSNGTNIISRKITTEDTGYKYYRVVTNDADNNLHCYGLKTIKYISHLSTLIEFSSLIDYEEEDEKMSAEDILHWFDNISLDIRGKVFDGLFDIDDIIMNYSYKDIIKKIILYNYMEKEQDHKQIEWANFVLIKSSENGECVYEERLEDGTKKEPTQRILTEYAETHNEYDEYYAVVERRCLKNW